MQDYSSDPSMSSDSAEHSIINTKEQQDHEREVLERVHGEGQRSLIDAAEALSRREVEEGEGADGHYSSKEIQQREIPALIKWAKGNGLLIPPDKFTAFWKEENDALQGAEHQVVFDADDTVIKRKMIWPQETYSGYLRRLQIHNSLSYAKFELMGFSEVTDAQGNIRVMPVVRQPYIPGRPAMFDEINAFMNKAGFEGEGGLYRDDFSGIVVYDAGENNAIIDHMGNLVPIDFKIDNEADYNRKFRVSH
ncbi:MAG: hypothetical protein M0Z67_11180 [Nitrospiraceae bacterium]|nr:hypothetical protein [Nitrospiraceae bacterium]